MWNTIFVVIMCIIIYTLLLCCIIYYIAYKRGYNKGFDTCEIIYKDLMDTDGYFMIKCDDRNNVLPTGKRPSVSEDNNINNSNIKLVEDITCIVISDNKQYDIFCINNLIKQGYIIHTISDVLIPCCEKLRTYVYLIKYKN